MINVFREISPRFAPGVRVAESAMVIGDVVLCEKVNLWYGVTVRGDSGSIQVGAESNIQDHVVLHASAQFPLSIGSGVTVGHGAILHGCTVGDGALIGMGAILLDGCIVGAGAMVGAGSLVTQGTEVPPRTLALGVPAKSLRPLREDELAANRRSAEEYLLLAEQLPNLEAIP